MILTKELKTQHMTELAVYKRTLWKQPVLKSFYVTVTSIPKYEEEE